MKASNNYICIAIIKCKTRFRKWYVSNALQFLIYEDTLMEVS